MPQQPLVEMCIDKVLPTLEQQIEAARRAIAENPENAPGHLPSPRFGVSPAAADRVRIAFVTGKKWSNGRTLRVQFVEGPPAVQEKVRHYAREWTDHGSITFDFVNDLPAEIRIGFESDGSWSYIGTDALSIPPGRPTMNYGWLDGTTPDDEYSRVVIHEFGHALGCVHEHQHPEAGIPWDRPAVYRYYMGPPNNWTKDDVDRNIFDLVPASQTQFSRFDPTSIMCYAVPDSLTLGTYSIGWNRQLSQTDKDFVGATYPRVKKDSVELQVGDAPVAASIGTHGEVDRYQFGVDTAGDYTIETHGRTDVVMTLAGPNDERHVIDEDDDSGRGRNAKIVRALAPGSYVVSVRHYRPRGTGGYRISVSAA